MTQLQVLFIGGNGTISAAVSRQAVAAGMDLTLLTRGQSHGRPPILGCRQLTGDATDPASIKHAIGGRRWDVVVNFQVFDGLQAEQQVEVFTGRTGQYIFISSAAAYQKPVPSWPIVESTLLANPFWSYARGKIDAEHVFTSAHAKGRLPVTIVRPAHTYDCRLIPLPGGWTTLHRMHSGLPIVIHGDGTSIWTLTHHEDFAVGLLGLFGLPAAIGQAVHITSDMVQTWDQIARDFGAPLGVEPDIVHIASESIARVIPEWGEPLLGDWSHSEIYDNSKIKSLVPYFVAKRPFSSGAREIVSWYQEDPGRQHVDAELNSAIDTLIDRFGTRSPT